MRLKIVGSAAGGGLPQWNCNYRLSRAARNGDGRVSARTQSSLAVSATAGKWVLFNASPDIRQQIAATPELQPQSEGPLRSTPIAAIVLTNADVDHIAGLLSLREREPFALYAAERVHAALAANPIFNVLDPSIVKRRTLPMNESIEVLDAQDRRTGIQIEAFVVPGKVALFLEGDGAGLNLASEEGDTIAVRISHDGTNRAPSGSAEVVYAPGCARIDDRLKARLEGAACIMFDGTLFTDDEMIVAGVGPKTGARMGHVAMSGEHGSLARLADVEAGRRIFVHINNTNPVLDPDSPEHQVVTEAGWEVAHDGM